MRPGRRPSPPPKLWFENARSPPARPDFTLSLTRHLSKDNPVNAIRLRKERIQGQVVVIIFLKKPPMNKI